MGLSTNTTTYAGGAQTFAVNFSLGFLSRADVQVRVNAAVDGSGDPVYTSFSWIDDSAISVIPTLTIGDTVEVLRTVSKTSLTANFAASTDVTPANLDISAKQGLMVYQELIDGRIDGAESPIVAANRAEAAALAAEAAQAAALVSEGLADADRVATNADVVTTNADVVSTNADVVSAEADKVQTGLDRIAVAADLVQTNIDQLTTSADVVLTNADVVSAEADKVQTGLDRIAVAADLVQTAADQQATAADRIAVAADLVQTDADQQATAADRVVTTADRAATNADVILAEADKVQTGLDRIAVAADLVQTNQDTIDTAADRIAVAADAVLTDADKTAAAASAAAAVVSADEAAASAASIAGTKLDGIEEGATADQTAAEIKAAYEANANTNVFLDAEKSKLTGIAAGATANVGDITGVTAGSGISGGGTSGTVTITNSAPNIVQTTITGNAGSATALSAGTHLTKLDGIETGATADQTAAQLLAALKTVDGNGSAGLNAGTMDGLLLNAVGRNNSANRIVRTQANGYVNFGWINTTSGGTTTAATDYYVNTNDGYIRKKTLANVKTELGVAVTSATTPTRAKNTWYQNTSGKSKFVCIQSTGANGRILLGVSTASYEIVTYNAASGSGQYEQDSMTIVVPPNWYYYYQTGNFTYWAEFW